MSVASSLAVVFLTLLSYSRAKGWESLIVIKRKSRLSGLFALLMTAARTRARPLVARDIPEAWRGCNAGRGSKDRNSVEIGPQHGKAAIILDLNVGRGALHGRRADTFNT